MEPLSGSSFLGFRRETLNYRYLKDVPVRDYKGISKRYEGRI